MYQDETKREIPHHFVTVSVVRFHPHVKYPRTSCYVYKKTAIFRFHLIVIFCYELNLCILIVIQKFSLNSGCEASSHNFFKPLHQICFLEPTTRNHVCNLCGVQTHDPEVARQTPYPSGHCYP